MRIWCQLWQAQRSIMLGCLTLRCDLVLSDRSVQSPRDGGCRAVTNKTILSVGGADQVDAISRYLGCLGHALQLLCWLRPKAYPIQMKLDDTSFLVINQTEIAHIIPNRGEPIVV